MKRILILLCLFLIGTLAILLIGQKTNNIALLEGRAVQSPHNDKAFMVSLRIENTGKPDHLIGVSSPSADHVSIMNPAYDGAPLIIPQDGVGILAMDGAHIMLMTGSDTFEAGAFLPLNLTFKNAGDVSVRVQNMGPTTMNHGQANGISANPSPALNIAWGTAPHTDGATLKLNTENFTFVRTQDGAAHVPNQGHAHVYLNGLKLGRLYTDTYKIGVLSPGTYKLSVGLNSNDHRPYIHDGQMVRGNLDFEIPE
jgi:copper(I)-binding protein